MSKEALIKWRLAQSLSCIILHYMLRAERYWKCSQRCCLLFSTSFNFCLISHSNENGSFHKMYSYKTHVNIASDFSWKLNVCVLLPVQIQDSVIMVSRSNLILPNKCFKISTCPWDTNLNRNPVTAGQSVIEWGCTAPWLDNTPCHPLIGQYPSFSVCWHGAILCVLIRFWEWADWE